MDRNGFSRVLHPNLGITKDGLKKPSWIGVGSKLQSQLSAEIYQVVRAYRLLISFNASFLWLKYEHRPIFARNFSMA